MIDTKNYSSFETAELKLNETYNYLEKEYLNYLDLSHVLNLPEEIKDTDFSSIRILKFERIIFDKDEDNLSKLLNIYKSLYNINSSFFTILEAKKDFVNFYIGVKIKDAKSALSPLETLRKGISGNFPGILYNEAFNVDEVENLMEKIVDGVEISSVTQVPSLKLEENIENKNYIQGIEKFIEGMKGQEYTAILLADPVSRDYLTYIKKVYQNLYNEIFPFSTIRKGISESEAISMMENYSEGNTISKTKGTSTSYTEGITTTNTYSTGVSLSETLSVFASLSISLSSGLGLGLPGAAAIQAAKSIGASMGTSLAKTLGVNLGYARSNSKSRSTTNSVNESDTKSTSINKGTSEGTTLTSGDSLDVTFENKGIKYLLEKIEVQFKRNKEFENYGAWQSAAYFISKDPEVSKIAASYYSSLISGENTNVEKSYVNTWFKGKDEKSVEKIKDYLFNLYHPIIEIDAKGTLTTPATLITTKELTISNSLPKKSIPGLPVHESVSFGREVFGKISETSFEIGDIYHLDRKENRKVKLDLDSLTSHTFITGSTGSGKSNVVYCMLEELRKNNVKFLVIEPAKGEYKNVFGGREDVSVYGTNINYTDLLKVNPFSFNEKIHILEHIDRLIEIFNACWSMYAAMPAILKDAIEKSYITLGWDLKRSKNLYGDRKFPTLSDLKKSLTNVINESSYSQESKSNYIGALVTRINSLENGLIGNIFCEDELSERELFDENVIVDISRIPSAETKSLVMGIVFMKLHEYRMSSDIEENSKLKHITVLEEAHNLLKKTSTEQSAEGANLQGKSVEMLTNAIAEMRTYGEGFIVADQAPGLLDQAVIRNTNTKICLRLPSLEDREIVGKSMNLNDEQIEELSKLETGVAAVIQSNWKETCLVKFTYMNNKFSYKYKIENNNENFFKNLFKIVLEDKLPVNENTVEEKDRKKVMEYFEKNNLSKNRLNNRVIDKLIFETIDGERILNILNLSTSNEDIKEWNKKLNLILKNILNIYESERALCLEISNSIMREKAIRNPSYFEFYNKWDEFIRKDTKIW
ncbi:helicase HerA domain-containing protein [Cetobacterium sp.]|uniref:ATP-binding protein n=1 Tax=Cetobacterium sp. TaxID=2071632 RepID=UPI003EE810D5